MHNCWNKLDVTPPALISYLCDHTQFSDYWNNTLVYSFQTLTLQTLDTILFFVVEDYVDDSLCRGLYCAS